MMTTLPSQPALSVEPFRSTKALTSKWQQENKERGSSDKDRMSNGVHRLCRQETNDVMV